MKRTMRDFPLTVEEVRALVKKEESKKYMWIAAAASVVAVLVGLVIWIGKKRERDLEEHYEYFDDDFDDLDENYEGFDESIYDDEDDTDEDEQIEYVKIKDFINDEEEIEKDTKEEAKEDVKEEASDK